MKLSELGFENLQLLLLAPFFLQGILMFVDEFYFHRKRGLPLWERIGHPLDTVSVACCYGFIVWRPFSNESFPIYVALCLFSCLLVTKDEFVHQKHCTGAENWLHAMLFILHPLVFVVAGFIWYLKTLPGFWESQNHSSLFLWNGLQFQLGLTLLFVAYQIIYWSFIWQPKRQ